MHISHNPLIHLMPVILPLIDWGAVSSELIRHPVIFLLGRADGSSEIIVAILLLPDLQLFDSN